MWKRKDLKIKAREIIKKNYWTAIVVCFIIAILTGEFGTSTIGTWKSDEPAIDPNYAINNINEKKERQNLNEQNNRYDELKSTLGKTELKIFETVEANLNSILKSQKYMFKIWDSVKSFNIKETEIGVVLAIGAVLAFAFTLFIADPLIVGGKRYFLKIGNNESTKIGIIVDVFKKENWINVAMIMFIRNIYNALWYLTIIGGIIKSYEYRMIPYILAENPRIKRKEAFYISKNMMKGNKWKTFILDMSFLGWNLLSVFTMGLLGILYVNPYYAATITELYLYLKENSKNVDLPKMKK